MGRVESSSNAGGSTLSTVDVDDHAGNINQHAKGHLDQHFNLLTQICLWGVIHVGIICIEHSR